MAIYVDKNKKFFAIRFEGFTLWKEKQALPNNWQKFDLTLTFGHKMLRIIGFDAEVLEKHL